MLVTSLLMAAITLVPAPLKLTPGEGVCELPPGKSAAQIAAFSVDPSIPKEGYRLRVYTNSIAVCSSDDAGAFYAVQTLRQLTEKHGGKSVCPCVEIEDAPMYRYRGVMLDEARHFFGKEVVKKELELMARHKLNVFHWHLVDDQGWRLEIKKHPELTRYGSVRPRSVAFIHNGRRDKEGVYHFDENTEKYGPFFYTQDDIREILAFAAARHITVIPEIEFSGHVRALLAARPDLSCVGESLARSPRVAYAIEDNVLCIGNPDSLAYFKDIFDEVCELFPSEVIHVGGDECPKKRWLACPKCQAKKRELGLDNERGLQSYFTSQIAAHLASKGRRIIGWDEVLYGDVPKNVIGMSWRMTAKGGAGGDYVTNLEALERGFKMVMTPHLICYYSRPQRLPEDPYPYFSPAGGISLEEAYRFDPAAGVPKRLRDGILGGQASLWSEVTFNVFDLEWKLWPRACAMAEVLWLPPEKRDWHSFRSRMLDHRKRLIANHVNCAPLQ